MNQEEREPLARNGLAPQCLGLAKSYAIGASPLQARACKPFLKWAGGKTQLLSELLQRVPADFVRYFEPFLGSGALFFALQPPVAYLSDTNAELINSFVVVRDQVAALMGDLSQHVYDREHFLRIRAADRSPEFANWTAVQKASRTIYLNKTCFNGLYRVNSRGYFNTPFGRYKNPRFLNEVVLERCACALKGTQLEAASYLEIEKIATAQDFVYFDPPYDPLSPTANYTAYTKDGFGLVDQTALRDLCLRLDKKGVRFLLSNAATDRVKELYADFRIEIVEVSRQINSKADRRGDVAEVLVRNY